MTTLEHPTHRRARGSVVVGVDGSRSSDQAVVWAAQEARLQHRGLTLAYAAPTVSSHQQALLASAGIPPAQVEQQLRGDSEVVVQQARSLASRHAPDVDVESLVLAQDPRHLLLELGATAFLTVVGTRGHGRVAGLLLGSVSGALVRHGRGPVVVVRHRPATQRGILVAADGSDESRGLLEHAYAEASLHGLRLTLVHCLWDGLVGPTRWVQVPEADPRAVDARLRIAESVAGMAEKFPDVETEVLVTRGVVEACLVDLSADYELLVIGRPPRPLLARLTLSGLTTPVVEHAHCPVLVVP